MGLSVKTLSGLSPVSAPPAIYTTRPLACAYKEGEEGAGDQSPGAHVPLAAKTAGGARTAADVQGVTGELTVIHILTTCLRLILYPLQEA